ncbi:dihydrofolate reductase [Natronorarus salvus]|uniref:dihydrofolate reductase n=1 Tax=Natronorarus salvus TaxID=3117733 RepID=UPI002F26526F
MEIVLVAAVSENGVVGSEGGVPWSYPEDVDQYKAAVSGYPVIVGRRTFDRMKPIEGSFTLVLTSDGSRSDDREEVSYVTDPAEAIDLAAERDDVVYVIGGGAVYDLYEPVATGARISRIPETVEGDSFFPDLGESWAVRETIHFDGFEIEVLENRSPAGVETLRGE